MTTTYTTPASVSVINQHNPNNDSYYYSQNVPSTFKADQPPPYSSQTEQYSKKY